MKNYLVPLCLAAVVLLFQGCASKQPSVPITERVQPGVAAGGQPTPGEGAVSQGKEGGITEEELSKAEQERRRKAAEEAAIAAHLQDVYFEFDSYTIRSDDMPILKKMADWLLANQAITLTVEGYCDERGTTEYNLALGQKRAEAAKDYFVKSRSEREQDKDGFVWEGGAGGHGSYRRSLGQEQAGPFCKPIKRAHAKR